MLAYLFAIYLATVLVSLAAFPFIIAYYIYNTMIGVYQQEEKIRFEKSSELFNKMVLRKMLYCFIPIVNVIISIIRMVNCDKNIDKAQNDLLNERKK